MLLRGRRWVVIEIDGIQHYATGKQASPLRALKKSGQHQVAIPWMVREELVAQRVLRYAEVAFLAALGLAVFLDRKRARLTAPMRPTGLPTPGAPLLQVRALRA